MKAFMFPGQGSQAKGMGGGLFDEFNDLTEKADRILNYSIKELCLEDPRNELSQTQFTQPALYVVNALSFFKKISESGEKPDYLLGHSLGEFNALLAAGCFDFEAGLKLVKKRGELMSQADGGGMMAVLNASKEEIEAVLRENGLSNIDLVNYNTHSQIVISGLKDEISRAQPLLQKGKVMCIPLNTSGAFHSRFMQPAKDKFETYLKKFKLSDLKTPVISNVTARPYQEGEVVETLSGQIASPVRWSDSIEYLMTLGDVEFEEMGHGDVLTKLVQKIRREATAVEAQNAGKVNVQKTSGVQTMTREGDVEEGKSQTVLTGAGTEREETSAGRQKNVRQPREETAVAVSAEVGVTENGKQLETETGKTAQAPAGAEDKVKAWNRRYRVGTPVKSSIADYGVLETRTEAMVLFGHRAAVYMKGYNGYFDLREVTPVE